MIAGIDVGGANTKVATSDGSFVRLIYAPLWRNKTIIYNVLADVKRELETVGKRIERVGAVMTGDLCGCFNTKTEGVLYIKRVVSDIFGNAKFFDSYCTFKNNPSVDKAPLSFAFATTADVYLVIGYTMGLNDSYNPPAFWRDGSVERAM